MLKQAKDKIIVASAMSELKGARAILPVVVAEVRCQMSCCPCCPLRGQCNQRNVQLGAERERAIVWWRMADVRSNKSG